ncbi:enoyl-CoA hydratase-related protein [Ruegeria sp. 2205SS24-7]|uniref:enoyl-CoA hydratase-related protein n=1 Tax=Ruegeria discodermiae TaxID=3064389 RepID=UPI0027405D6D|nr:enoyl-CoA hydratase-related protein [Ruegeria sp. 2205SS24-7]MDP5219529.1 enoyl-CoA hydratase-related protein [Ruegeria sp. 2205SS24-7]
MTSGNAQVISEKSGAILHLIMSAPQTKNALTNDMYRTMVSALEDAAQDSAIRVVLLSGAGGVFTSGNDVNSFAQAVKTGDLAAADFLRAIIGFPKPIVAQVEALAIGIGTTMLLHCDLIYAAEDTRFQMPFVDLGLVPEAGASYLVPRMVGQAKAAELILLGRMFDAGEALEMGFINAVLPATEVAQAAQAAVDTLSKRAPVAMAKSKALLRASEPGNLMDRVNAELVDFAEGVKSAEFAEAYTAFLEKRAPKF